MEWITAMSCMEFNTYVIGVAAAAITGNIFWFFKWAAAEGKHRQLLADMGIDN